MQVVRSYLASVATQIVVSLHDNFREEGCQVLMAPDHEFEHGAKAYLSNRLAVLVSRAILHLGSSHLCQQGATAVARERSTGVRSPGAWETGEWPF